MNYFRTSEGKRVDSERRLQRRPHQISPGYIVPGMLVYEMYMVYPDVRTAG